MTSNHMLFGVDRRRLYQILEEGAAGDVASRVADGIVILIILLNVLAVVIETAPAIAERYARPLRVFEIASVAFFTLEYAARLWVAPEHVPYSKLSPARARLAWAMSPGGIIDLLAILPFYLGLLFAADLRFVRIFRLVRFLKLARYSTGMRSLFEAIHSERRALMGSLVIMVGLVLTASSLAYMAERDVQPDAFGSIPSAIWWATATVTTVGYGDVVPVTLAGKMLGVVVMLFGFAMFALPVGIVATAFASEIHRREFVVTWGMVARVPLFSELDATEVAEIMRLLHARAAVAGETIARKGDVAASMYFIVSGEVEIDLDDQPIRLSEGTFFGEIALLRKSKRSATVTAVSRVNLLVLDAGDLHSLMDRRPKLARRIHDVARERIGTERLTPGGDLAAEELMPGGADAAETKTAEPKKAPPRKSQSRAKKE